MRKIRGLENVSPSPPQDIGVAALQQRKELKPFREKRTMQNMGLSSQMNCFSITRT